MIPLGTAILTFFLVEGIYLQTIYNLEAGFLPAVGLGTVAAIAVQTVLARGALKRDNPEPLEYLVPRTKAFAIVKRIIRTYSYSFSRWRINFDDKLTGELQASIHFIDDGWQDQRWLVPSGRLDRVINLYALLTAKTASTTTVQLVWQVDSPLSRSDCDYIIADITTQIHQALADAECAQNSTRQKSS